MSKRTCSVDGCESVVLARGWCSKHYARWRAHREPTPSRSCVVENCDRPYYGRSWCNKHYTAWFKWGDPLTNKTKVKPDVDRVCLVDDCGLLAYVPGSARGWCEKHYNRWQRWGDPVASAPPGHARRALVDNPAVHARVRRDRGSASSHSCIDCGQAAAHWSYDHADPNELMSKKGPYSLNVEHYQPRCVVCHKRFDGHMD